MLSTLSVFTNLHWTSDHRNMRSNIYYIKLTDTCTYGSLQNSKKILCETIVRALRSFATHTLANTWSSYGLTIIRIFPNPWWCYFPTPGCAICLQSCSTMYTLLYSSRDSLHVHVPSQYLREDLQTTLAMGWLSIAIPFIRNMSLFTGVACTVCTCTLYIVRVCQHCILLWNNSIVYTCTCMYQFCVYCQYINIVNTIHVYNNSIVYTCTNIVNTVYTMKQ